jgi:hypothetical protein
MSETPETDAFLRDLNDYSDVELRAITEHARKLERERDEATTRRMETIMQCELYEQERDEAREQVKELIYIASRAISLAEIDFENDKFGIVSELRYELRQIMQEGAE